MDINDQLKSLVESIAQEVLEKVQKQIDDTVTSTVTRRVSESITGNLIGDVISKKINNSHLTLVEKSIPGNAIDTKLLEISGDNVSGGTITKFSSTGIEDTATSCKLTIMDAGTVFENTLYSPRVEVKGDAVVDGDLLIKGSIKRDSTAYQNIINDIESISNNTYDRVLNTIKTETFDISKLTIGQRSIIEGDTLTSAIANSNLRRVGILQDLQTSGESLLSQTLYTSNKRVGINTMDPNTALSIWDEEVEIGIGKRSQGTAQVVTRASTMILGVNAQNNITLTNDGNVVVKQIKIGNIQFSTSPTTPTTQAEKGTVVFNENPSLGGPLGWVSLGDARWANFGIID